MPTTSTDYGLRRARRGQRARAKGPRGKKTSFGLPPSPPKYSFGPGSPALNVVQNQAAQPNFFAGQEGPGTDWLATQGSPQMRTEPSQFPFLSRSGGQQFGADSLRAALGGYQVGGGAQQVPSGVEAGAGQANPWQPDVGMQNQDVVQASRRRRLEKARRRLGELRLQGNLAPGSFQPETPLYDMDAARVQASQEVGQEDDELIRDQFIGNYADQLRQAMGVGRQADTGQFRLQDPGGRLRQAAPQEMMENMWPGAIQGPMGALGGEDGAREEYLNRWARPAMQPGTVLDVNHPVTGEPMTREQEVYSRARGRRKGELGQRRLLRNIKARLGIRRTRGMSPQQLIGGLMGEALTQGEQPGQGLTDAFMGPQYAQGRMEAEAMTGAGMNQALGNYFASRTESMAANPGVPSTPEQIEMDNRMLNMFSGQGAGGRGGGGPLPSGLGGEEATEAEASGEFTTQLTRGEVDQIVTEAPEQAKKDALTYWQYLSRRGVRGDMLNARVNQVFPSASHLGRKHISAFAKAGEAAMRGPR